MSDTLHKFLFDAGSSTRSPVRGEIVSLAATWRQIKERHSYPEPVLRMLGELVAASALLSANLKFNGALIMQIHGDGPVKLLVVECNADLTVRATVKLSSNQAICDDATFTDLVNVSGEGRFAITLDPRDRSQGQQPYQGIVPLEGATVAAALEGYMRRSEQLDTQLWLAADGEHANGLLLQKLPLDGGSGGTSFDPDAETRAEEVWERAVTFANTLERNELLRVDPPTLMRRLFWEETLAVYDPVPCAFRCSCTRERVAAMLISLGEREVDETLTEMGGIHVDCEFCNKSYDFDTVDCAQLFATSNTMDGVRAPVGHRH
ncbi:MAG: Hsp33 family molecular chaperone HslO [Burkholderiaceae bacterium]